MFLCGLAALLGYVFADRVGATQKTNKISINIFIKTFKQKKHVYYLEVSTSCTNPLGGLHESNGPFRFKRLGLRLPSSQSGALDDWKTFVEDMKLGRMGRGAKSVFCLFRFLIQNPFKQRPFNF